MFTSTRGLSIILMCMGCFTASRAMGQFVGEPYELRQGSMIVDECLFCDRAPIERPLTGSFVLTLLPSLVCCVYEVSELTFVDPSGEYSIKGGGMYGTNSIGDITQQMSLNLGVNGLDGVELGSGAVKIPVPFPALEITVTEDGTREPAHKYTIRLLAAPRKERVLYELVEGDRGSRLFIDCPPCEIINPEVPISGTFRLARLNDEVNPFGLYAVDFVDLRSTLPGVEYSIGGSGVYEQGGEVALTQHMNLGVAINDQTGIILDSGVGPIPDGVTFPEISIDLAHQNPQGSFIYSLHLVARPATTAKRNFRRADSNGDGKIDISDAVHILNWRFSGGAEPGCLEAADTNADARHDLTDAIFLLNYLFLAGKAPPFPGPDDCGAPERPAFGCDSYTACGV